MEALTFIKKYGQKGDFGQRAGIYSIYNPDFKEGHDLNKVGLASSFVNRFSGQEHSGYGTSYPTGFKVQYLMTVPNISSSGWTSTKPQKRVHQREREVHEALEGNNFNRVMKENQKRPTEWFKAKNRSDILKYGLLPVWKMRNEQSIIYECDETQCKKIHEHDKPDKLPKRDQHKGKRSGRTTKQTEMFDPEIHGLYDTGRRQKTELQVEPLKRVRKTTKQFNPEVDGMNDTAKRAQSKRHHAV